MDLRDQILKTIYGAIDTGTYVHGSDQLAKRMSVSEAAIIDGVNSIKAFNYYFITRKDGSGDSQIYIYPERASIPDVKSFLLNGGFEVLQKKTDRERKSAMDRKQQEENLMQLQIRELQLLRKDRRISKPIAILTFIMVLITLALEFYKSCTPIKNNVTAVQTMKGG